MLNIKDTKKELDLIYKANMQWDLLSQTYINDPIVLISFWQKYLKCLLKKD